MEALIADNPSIVAWTDYVWENDIAEDTVPLLGAFLQNDSEADTAVIPIKKPYNLATECEELSKNIYTKGVEDLADLYRCIGFAGVTRALQNQKSSLREDAPDFVRNVSFYNVRATKQNEAIAKQLSINIGETFQHGCYEISCGRRKAEGEGKAGNTKMSQSCTPENLFAGNTTRLQLHNVLECRSDMCARVKGLIKADVDIGGVGVFASYVLQLLIALGIAIYIFVKFACGMFKRRRMQQLHANRTIEVHSAFVKALISFQRVQAWFVASLVIAGCIRNLRHAVSDVDRYLLLAITLNGLALLSFSLLTVHHISRKSSWTTLILSAISFIICAVFYCIALGKRVNRVERLYENLWTCSEPELEGINMPAIRQFLNTVAAIPKGVYGFVLVFTSIMMVAVILDNTKKIGGMWHRQSSLVRGVIWAVAGTIYAAIVVMQLFIMGPYFKVVDYKDWGFGQLMAISFWLPLVYDYLSERYWDDEEEKKDTAMFQEIKRDHEDYEMR